VVVINIAKYKLSFPMYQSSKTTITATVSLSTSNSIPT
jgi:hypothetical protein